MGLDAGAAEALTRRLAEEWEKIRSSLLSSRGQLQSCVTRSLEKMLDTNGGAHGRLPRIQWVFRSDLADTRHLTRVDLHSLVLPLHGRTCGRRRRARWAESSRVRRSLSMRPKAETSPHRTV